MRFPLRALAIAFLVAVGVAAIASTVSAEIAKPSLELSFEETGEGLTYAVYGESVVSQSRIYPKSTLDISDLPEGAVIVKAFLYWSGELEPRKSADTKVELKGPNGKAATIHAERVWTDLVSGLVYVSRAEISGHLKERGIYSISQIDADPLEPAEIAGKVQKKAHYTLGGWALVVVFKDPALKTKANVQLYDGLLYLPSGDAQREGRFGLERLGHAVSKETLYPRAALKIKSPGSALADTLDLAVIAGLGKPWDGGSVLFDEAPVSGQEDFAGGAGFAWDVSRSLVPLKKSRSDVPLEVEFQPDYNSVMPIAVVAKFGSLQGAEVLRLASSYLKQADRVGELEFFDRRDTALGSRESAAKGYIKGLLRSRAAALFETVKVSNVSQPQELHRTLGRLYFGKGLLDLAEMELKEAAGGAQADGRAYLDLGRLYYAKRQMDEAIRWLKKAKAASGPTAEICLDLGICFFQKGLANEAIAQFEEAIRLNPRNPVPYHRLASVYQTQGWLARKVAALKRLELVERDGRK